MLKTNFNTIFTRLYNKCKNSLQCWRCWISKHTTPCRGYLLLFIDQPPHKTRISNNVTATDAIGKN